MGMLICGMPAFDLKDFRKNLRLEGYENDDPMINWLFEILEDYDLERRCLFLMFGSGSGKVPIGGFANLAYGKFKIEKCGDPNNCPIAHTCYNHIEMPEYPSKEEL